jgi:hypothetical protein
VGVVDPYYYAVALALLLGVRAWAALRRVASRRRRVLASPSSISRPEEPV